MSHERMTTARLRRRRHSTVLAAGSAFATLAATSSDAGAESVTMTFEGVGNNNAVGSFYASPYGVSFTNLNAQVPDNAGGTWGIRNLPSPSTAAGNAYYSGTSPYTHYDATMNVGNGFTTFSTRYTNPYDTGTVSIYSGLNGSGTLLGSATFGTTADGPDPYGAYDTWNTLAPSFSGVGRSAVIHAPGEYISYDNMSVVLARRADWSSSATNAFWENSGSWTGGGLAGAANAVTFSTVGTFSTTLYTAQSASSIDVTAGAVTFDMSTYASYAPSITSTGNVTINSTGGPRLTVHGGKLALGAGARITVGNTTSGELVVDNGATVTALHLVLGDNASASYGKATITGVGTTATFGGEIDAGDSGSGDVYILDGATATASSQVDAGTSVGQRGYVAVGSVVATPATLNAGAVVAGGYLSGPSYVHGGAGEFHLKSNGVINATTTAVLNTNGTYFYLEGGTLKTTALNVETNSRFSWTGGTLQLGGGTANLALTVPTFGILAGTGTIQGAVVVNDSGMLAPGTAGIGTLNVQSDLEVGGNGILSWDFDANGNADRVVGLGTANHLVIDGAGELRLISPDGVSSPAGPITLLTGFESITGLANFRDWTVQLNGFNVDGAKFAFNASTGTLSVALPEPATLAVATLASAALTRRSRRRATMAVT